MKIFYICDGKREKCRDSRYCYYNGKDKSTCCFRTCEPEHARYGECKGDPSWFPERFAIAQNDVWYEKEKW